MPLESKAISTEEIKEKLRNLKEYMPGEPEITYDFATYLANRLNPKLNPGGFQISAELLLSDMKKGVDSFTRQAMSRNLAGYPPNLYAILRGTVPDIAKAVCPEDFAKSVKDFYEEVNAKMREEK